MLDTRASFISRLLLSEPAEAAKLAVTDAELCIDGAVSHLRLSAVALIRALLRTGPVQTPAAPGCGGSAQTQMLRQVGNCVERSLAHLRDAHEATTRLSKNPRLIPADREKISQAVTDMVTAQIILSEVSSTVGQATNSDGSDLPGAGELLLNSLSRARSFTRAAYQRLASVPTVPLVYGPVT